MADKKLHKYFSFLNKKEDPKEEEINPRDLITPRGVASSTGRSDSKSDLDIETHRKKVNMHELKMKEVRKDQEENKELLDKVNNLFSAKDRDQYLNFKSELISLLDKYKDVDTKVKTISYRDAKF